MNEALWNTLMDDGNTKSMLFLILCQQACFSLLVGPILFEVIHMSFSSSLGNCLKKKSLRWSCNIKENGRQKGSAWYSSYEWHFLVWPIYICLLRKVTLTLDLDLHTEKLKARLVLSTRYGHFHINWKIASASNTPEALSCPSRPGLFSWSPFTTLHAVPQQQGELLA